MVFNEVDCNLYFIARDKFIQHDIIIGIGIGILYIPWYWIKNMLNEKAVDTNIYDKQLT